MRRKHISVSRILEFMRCPKAYWASITRAFEKQTTESEVIGDATAKLTAGETPAKTREFVEEKLQHLPELRRESVMETAVQIAATAVQMSAPEVTNERREVQLMWHDPETGYDIYAKPDELFFFDEEGTDRYGQPKTKSVMQITDDKALATEIRSYHWRQVFLFGLIASLSLKYYHSIKLVVRLAGVGYEEYRWFSQRETYRQLERLRATLRQIDTAWATRTFEEKPGGFCANCPLLATCEKGTAFLRQREVEQRLFEVEQDDDGDGGATRFPLRVIASTNTQACA